MCYHPKLMSIVSMIGALCGANIVSAGFTSPVSAQDCGDLCKDCGWFRHEGVDFSTNGMHDMECNTFSSWCDDCPFSVSAGNDAAAGIVALIASASEDELGAVVETFRDRLLIHAARRLLVVQGTRCDPAALATVAYLPVEKTDALVRLGVRSLERHLRPLKKLSDGTTKGMPSGL